MTGVVYGFFGMETRGRSFESIEDELNGKPQRELAVAAAVGASNLQHK
jgi:hypothetical protein